jgi:hypothetical protein
MMHSKVKEEKLFNIVSDLHDVEVELFDRAGNDFDEMLAKQLQGARKQLENLMKGESHA